MPNETIVQYILNVETGKAEKGLKETAQTSKQVEQSFEQVGQATTQMNQKLKQTEKQGKRTEKSFRGMRKAGRDLDGALMDMAQGARLLDPALADMFMTMSDGASVMDGVARIGVGVLNPAILGVGLVTASAALAFSLFQKSQEQAAEQARILEGAETSLNKALENQEKVLLDVQRALGSYITDLNLAQAELSVLEGSITSFDLARDQATQRSAQQFAAASVELDKQEFSQKKSIANLERLIKLKTEQIRLNEFETKAGRETAFNVRANLESALKGQKFELELIEKQRESELKRSKDMEKILIDQIDLNERKKEEGEIERKNTKWRAKNAREQKEQQAAAKKLQGIINKLTLGELTGREKILEQYNQELAVIEELEKTTGDMFAAAEAELLLREKRDRLLDEELKKEKKRLGTAQDMLSIVAATASAMRSPESFVSSLGAIVGQVGTAGGFAGAASLAPAISGGGSAAVAIAGFGGLIQQAIDEAAKQEIPVILDEKQAERVVLGNMNEAFSNFIRDLERGLELLPETIVRVLPAFIVSIGKILTFDIHKMIAIDLPLALLRATPELVIAIINEIGFILADLINGFRLALDQFTAFIQAVFTKEGRQDAIADSIDGLKRWFETRFTGVEAVRDAIGAFAGGGSFIPQAAGGMRYTGNQRSGLAMLHQGEFVVPQSGMRPQSVDRQMSSSGGSPINIVINSPVVEQNAVDALVRRIEERFNSNFGLSSSNLFGGR